MDLKSVMPPDAGEWDLTKFQALPIPRAQSHQVRFEDLNEEENSTYVASFMPPRVGRSGQLMCAGCGFDLTGWFGRFTYGIQWGEGHCDQCRYPCRALHKIGDQVAELVLQYHPDELRQKPQPCCAWWDKGLGRHNFYCETKR